MRALSIASRGRGALTLAPKARMRSRPLQNQRDSWLGAPRPAEGKECGVSRTCASLPKGFLQYKTVQNQISTAGYAADAATRPAGVTAGQGPQAVGSWK